MTYWEVGITIRELLDLLVAFEISRLIRRGFRCKTWSNVLHQNHITVGASFPVTLIHVEMMASVWSDPKDNTNASAATDTHTGAPIVIKVRFISQYGVYTKRSNS